MGDSHLNANRPWVEEGERGREEFVLSHSTGTSFVVAFFRIFFPTSPERQLSNSFKCVKPNVYFLLGSNIWFLNKEEQISIWPPPRILGVRMAAAMGAQISQWNNANVFGVTLP